MARVTRIYLVAGVLGLVLGLAVSVDIIDSKAYPMLTVALPAGAICLGLFFICYIFENDAARFDQEQRARLNRGDHGREAGGAAVVPSRSGGRNWVASFSVRLKTTKPSAPRPRES